MPYDPSADIEIIRSNLLGEDVRDAIIRLFGTVEQASVGVTLTLAEYNALTEEEKNNGTLYFVSDMTVSDGEETYIGSATTDTSHVVITRQTALAIVDAVKELTGIDASILLPEIPEMIAGFGMLVKRKWHILSACRNYNRTWYYSNSETTPYVIDIYPVKAGRTYKLGPGAVTGNLFNATFFTADPTTYTANVTNGTNITYTSSVTAFTVYTFTPSVDGFISITASGQSDEDVETFVIRTEDLNRVIKISYGKEYEYDGDDEDEVEEEEVEEEP